MRFFKFANVRRVVTSLVGIALPSVALACPLCKDALANDPVAAAFNGTTFLLIAAPSLLVASIGGWVFYVYWRAARHATGNDRGGSCGDPLRLGRESET